jgi:hypothetical protein
MILDLLAERLFAKLPAGCRERGVGPVGAVLRPGSVRSSSVECGFTLSTRLGQLWITERAPETPT